MLGAMPRKSRLRLPPLRLGKETIGQRLARLRKQRGYTQVELAKKIGIIQALVSSYERDKLRLHAEMVIRFAQALGITADHLLGLEKLRTSTTGQPSLRILRRIQKIESLPPSKQRAVLKTIDALINNEQG